MIRAEKPRSSSSSRSSAARDPRVNDIKSASDRRILGSSSLAACRRSHRNVAWHAAAWETSTPVEWPCGSRRERMSTSCCDTILVARVARTSKDWQRCGLESVSLSVPGPKRRLGDVVWKLTVIAAVAVEEDLGLDGFVLCTVLLWGDLNDITISTAGAGPTQRSIQVHAVRSECKPAIWRMSVKTLLGD